MAKISSIVLVFTLISCGKIKEPVSNLINPAHPLGQQNATPRENATPLEPPFHEKCGPIPVADRILNGSVHEFYTLAEDKSRVAVGHDHQVYVVGDTHGSWEVMVNVLIKAGVMEPNFPVKKEVKIKYKGRSVKVSIPNLKFRQNVLNKVIFMGDYIAKSSPGRQQRIIALLQDVLEMQKGLSLAEPAVIAILGNHDFEAVNGIDHPGYEEEKDFKEQILSMVKADIALYPSYFYQGIWYSHSYLTPHDVNELDRHGINFRGGLTSLADQSRKVNDLVKNLITSNTVRGTWIESSSGGRPDRDNSNFLYAVRSKAADGTEDPDSSKHYTKFPIIIGHLSDRSRKVIRVLVEGSGGHILPTFANRSHILCVDTTIYDSVHSKTPATFLKINYRSASSFPVEFQSCTMNTK